MRDMAYSIHLAKRKTNKILEKYGTDNGYRMEDVNAKELYHALFEFYAWNEIVGHTITHKDGILYIDGAIKARFAHKDTLNKRLARAAITSPDYEGMILRRQEADHE